MRDRYRTLRLILGDQLNPGHSWFKKVDDDVLYIIAEMGQEVSYVVHHVQKVCAFFKAMENFAQALQKKGHAVVHLTLDDTAKFQDAAALLTRLCERYKVETLEYQRPDEYRLLISLRELVLPRTISTKEVSTEHFLLRREEFSEYLKKGRANRMEAFYRKMRRRFNILMDGDKPSGGNWNYDSENRERLNQAELDAVPEPLVFANDVSAILERLERHKVATMGKGTEKLLWPCSRQQARQLLSHFCNHCLPLFGRYQDAMVTDTQRGWSLYHSRLSFALNAKMLSPLEVIRAALDAWSQAPGKITIAQVEGFIRQILGWREFVRAVYWLNMPKYTSLNALKAQNRLPEFFWTGDTHMQCMRQSLGQSLDFAYAHHIQRLMVIGNFCLLTGIHPDDVDRWYLGIYVDAIEWVELPNTRGMSQFADGGWIASKPYASSGNYINKMSDYCRNCHYSVKKKHEEDACPFNSLYWHFLHRHRKAFEKNPRLSMAYKNWDKQKEADKRATLKRAQQCIQSIGSL